MKWCGRKGKNKRERNRLRRKGLLKGLTYSTRIEIRRVTSPPKEKARGRDAIRESGEQKEKHYLRKEKGRKRKVRIGFCIFLTKHFFCFQIF